jgi:hypothetical protein
MASLPVANRATQPGKPQDELRPPGDRLPLAVAGTRAARQAWLAAVKAAPAVDDGGEREDRAGAGDEASREGDCQQLVTPGQVSL